MEDFGGRIDAGVNSDERCVVCGKHIRGGRKYYCSIKCEEQDKREVTDVDKEVQFLLRQYREGGWKGRY